jgi:YgiT-type zinc finger domain-containing protein
MLPLPLNPLTDLVCPACHLGRMHLRMTVYSRQFGETIISVPNTPAWECDVCHEREFDPQAVQRIEMLVGQAGPPPNQHKSSDKGRTIEAAVVTKKSTKDSAKKSAKPKANQAADEPKAEKPRGKAKP